MKLFKDARGYIFDQIDGACFGQVPPVDGGESVNTTVDRGQATVRRAKHFLSR